MISKSSSKTFKMKAFAVLAALLSVATAANPLLASRAVTCDCDISKCPTSGDAVILTKS